MTGKIARLRTLAKRFFRIYANPPKESRIFLEVRDLPVLAERSALHKTRREPKQIAADPKRRLAFVSCMRGQAVQVFDYSKEALKLVRELDFPEQCVEVEVVGDLCFITTTNFARGPQQQSHLSILNIASGEILSTIDSGGEWSKVVKIHPYRDLAFVSNWHSHDVSVIDISDSKNLRLVQKIPCGESPRGIAFTEEGLCLVAGFYSGRVYTLEENDGRFEVMRESQKFDPTGYSGNMRDILVAPDGQIAWVSNLGRNLVHRFDISKGEITGSVLVGKSPNSIRLLDDSGKTLLVSCREANTICFLDTERLEVVGRSEETGRKPTGLVSVGGGFLATSFEEGSLEYHRVKCG